MPYRSPEYRQKLIRAIEDFQDEELLSDRELSLQSWLSPSMVSKIKNGSTIPKLSTLRKLKSAGVVIPKPERVITPAERI